MSEENRIENKCEDAVQVVRCKDCLHGAWRGTRFFCGVLDCFLEPNFYCAYGKRIEWEYGNKRAENRLYPQINNR